MFKLITMIMLLISLVVVSGCSDDDDDIITPIPEITVAQAMDSLSRYEDITLALQDGYVGDLFFVTDSASGASMGLHFMNAAIEGIDPYKPQLLLYGVSESGQYELAAAEWFVPSELVSEAPTLFGETFKGPREGHDPDMPEHYDLHVWMFKDNPDGMFADYNPDMTPPSFMNTLMSTHLAIIESFSDVQAAIDAGYESTIDCDDSPDGEGGMGVHYVNVSVLDINSEMPGILLYEPQADSSFMLVATEWFAPTDAVSGPPVLFGQTFNGPMEGHDEGQPEHYDLHVWLAKTNPSGIFADYNPTVECP